ncbi:MAG: CPBP family intramembrane glutamic endopeptidase [Elusimicrobiota bacterium]
MRWQWAQALWRAFRAAWVYETVVAVAGLLIRTAAPKALRHSPSNYPAGQTLADPVREFIFTNLYVPISEEILVRGALFCALYSLLLSRPRMKRWAFWIAAGATAALFVSVHETLNFYLVTKRAVGALLACSLFVREGLVAVILMHALHNCYAGIPDLWLFVPLLTVYPALSSLVREERPARFVMDRPLRLSIAGLASFLLLQMPAIRPPPSTMGSGFLLTLAALVFLPLVPRGAEPPKVPPFIVRLVQEVDAWIAFIRRHTGRCWRGEQMLARAFWAWFLAPQAFYILTVMRYRGVHLLLLAIPAFIAYGFWASIVLWRCAFNGAGFLWGLAARLVAAAGFLCHTIIVIMWICFELFD